MKEIDVIAKAIALSDKIDNLIIRRDKVIPSGLFDHQDPDAIVARYNAEIEILSEELLSVALIAAEAGKAKNFACKCCGQGDAVAIGQYHYDRLSAYVRQAVTTGYKHRFITRGHKFNLSASKIVIAVMEHFYDRCNHARIVNNPSLACNVATMKAGYQIANV